MDYPSHLINPIRLLLLSFQQGLYFSQRLKITLEIYSFSSTFHGCLVNAFLLIGIIDCSSSYGIVLFYPVYQWVRSGSLLS